MNNALFAPRNIKKDIDVLRVLVVDDDPFQLEVISDCLQNLGARQITLCAGGSEALQEIAKSKIFPFDLMLIDLQMPGMDGFEFMAAVALGGFKGGLIIVSGQTSDVLHSASLVARLRRFNLLGLLPKPVEKNALAVLMSPLS